MKRREGSFNGAMGWGIMACLVASCGTHVSRGVGVDLTCLEGDNRRCALIAYGDVDSTSVLPNTKVRQQKASTPMGRWMKFQGRVRRQALTVAVLE